MKRPMSWLMIGVLTVVAGCSASGGDELAEESASSTDVPVTAAPAPTVVTTTTLPPTDEEIEAARRASCVTTVVAGDSLGQIAARTEGVGLAELQAENSLDRASIIHPGDELDICIGNDIDDVTGSSRLAPPVAAVKRQQSRLNQLFAPYRLIPLGIDGDSGPLTRQMLCAARAGLGLPVTGGHMAEGSEEEELLMRADGFDVPAGAPTWSSKWIVIDKTCQVMFTGEGEELVNIYPTSTGEPGFETAGGQSFTAARYDPAVETDGWHDSSSFPVAIDNPLNGNMYKPLYFNGGQAIHGANFVPPFPKSKGCARTFPLHQDELIRWIGLEDRTEATWRAADIGVTVTVQGAFRSID